MCVLPHPEYLLLFPPPVFGLRQEQTLHESLQPHLNVARQYLHICRSYSYDKFPNFDPTLYWGMMSLGWSAISYQDVERDCHSCVMDNFIDSDRVCVLQVLTWMESHDLLCNCSSACEEKSYEVDISSSRWPAERYEVSIYECKRFHFMERLCRCWQLDHSFSQRILLTRSNRAI